jgi:hypothetical protein
VPDPVAKGEPVTGTSKLPAATENIDTESALAVAIRVPFGLNATEFGCGPVANGDPLTGANASAADAHRHAPRIAAAKQPARRRLGVA